MAWFTTLVVTPYNSATSLSRMTCVSLMIKKKRRLPICSRAAYWMLFLIPFVESLFDFFNGRKVAAKIFRQSLT